jgi:hypothetical protein
VEKARILVKEEKEKKGKILASEGKTMAHWHLNGPWYYAKCSYVLTQ